MEVTCDFTNAEYHYCKLTPQHAKIKCDIICPATAKHIVKFSESHPGDARGLQQGGAPICREPRARQPHRLGPQYSGQEDRVLFEDPDPVNGFVLLPDAKWDQSVVSTLYCLAIVNRRDLLSIRSLTQEHLGLLQNILEKGCNTIMERFGVPREKLRIFFHYHPTFYHLHFCHLQYDNPVPDARRSSRTCSFSPIITKGCLSW